ncbi:vanZ like family protein [bacterium BMS3Abin09]|nr:vanZ like family protein [bacterium BMS3Abin09]GBE40907.1 vanZ like family protein [bacterium BMS3Bbin09]
MGSDKKMQLRNAVVPWLATIGYMSLIFLLSSMQLQIPSQLPEYSDKLVHALIYMPLAFLFFVSLRKSGLNKYILLISFLLAGIYGITDELHQSCVPGRDAAVADAVADFFGAIIGSFGASRVKF